MGEKAHVLMANMHHSTLDGLSSELLQRELALAYAAARSGTQPAWPPLPLTCADAMLYHARASNISLFSF